MEVEKSVKFKWLKKKLNGKLLSFCLLEREFSNFTVQARVHQVFFVIWDQSSGACLRNNFRHFFFDIEIQFRSFISIKMARGLLDTY